MSFSAFGALPWLKFLIPSAEMSVRQEANGQAHYMRVEFVSMAFGISLGFKFEMVKAKVQGNSTSKESSRKDISLYPLKTLQGKGDWKKIKGKREVQQEELLSHLLCQEQAHKGCI